MRFPNFADVGLAALVLLFAAVVSGAFTLLALYFHLGGVTTLQQVSTDMRYALGSQGLWYLFSLAGFIFLFPLFWHTSFFSGVQWRIAAALRQRWHLLQAAVFCVVLAMVDSYAMPGPQNAPIDEIFRRPGAA